MVEFVDLLSGHAVAFCTFSAADLHSICTFSVTDQHFGLYAMNYDSSHSLNAVRATTFARFSFPLVVIIQSSDAASATEEDRKREQFREKYACFMLYHQVVLAVSGAVCIGGWSACSDLGVRSRTVHLVDRLMGLRRFM